MGTSDVGWVKHSRVDPTPGLVATRQYSSSEKHRFLFRPPFESGQGMADLEGLQTGEAV